MVHFQIKELEQFAKYSLYIRQILMGHPCSIVLCPNRSFRSGIRFGIQSYRRAHWQSCQFYGLCLLHLQCPPSWLVEPIHWTSLTFSTLDRTWSAVGNDVWLQIHGSSRSASLTCVGCQEITCTLNEWVCSSLTNLPLSWEGRGLLCNTSWSIHFYKANNKLEQNS